MSTLTDILQLIVNQNEQIQRLSQENLELKRKMETKDKEISDRTISDQGS